MSSGDCGSDPIAPRRNSTVTRAPMRQKLSLSSRTFMSEFLETKLLGDALREAPAQVSGLAGMRGKRWDVLRCRICYGHFEAPFLCGVRRRLSNAVDPRFSQGTRR